ncbi:MAG: MauE/DoxX family redox-associated membrane protein [Planctomycetota bacterium]|jgi:uncharacterized membrane protein YphA (DoxX/SURF4 family)
MSEQPGLLRRVDRSGVLLLIARLMLGLVFIWMGFTKTGLAKVSLDKMGLLETSAVKSMVDKGMIELSDPIAFLKLIREYETIPDSQYVLLNIIGGVLPWFEVACGLLLIAGVALRGTALILLMMLAGFTVMVTMRAIDIYQTEGLPFCDIEFNCGCGAGVVRICRKLPENTFLLLLSLVVLLSRSRRFCLWGDVPKRAAAPVAE